eukprot:GILI01001710.1.p1 GENE.GILI01001710.1~~GILI01001710.1.p1  ORF type:complete len:268 (+),score=92.14 GILI01001710.1:138-941(+)
MEMPKEKKTRRRRARRAPGAPKRPLSAYMIFGKEMRPRIIEEHPDFSVTDVMKEIGRRWAELNQEEKCPFEEKASEDKQRYEAELSSYTGPLKVPPKQKFKDPDRPKRGLSAYMVFAKEIRPFVVAENPDLTTPDIMKQIGLRWANLTEEEKEPYKIRSAEDKLRFKREQAEYDRQQFMNAPKRKKRDPQMPKRALTAYMFFNKDMRDRIKEQHSEASVMDIMKEVGARWASLTDEEKRPYEDLAAADKERYEMEMRHYGGGSLKDQ